MMKIVLRLIILSVSLLWVPTLSVNAIDRDDKIINPIDYYLKSHNIKQVDDFNEPTRLMKFEADLNNDGLQDVAVSDTTEWCGNNGGEWDLYLKKTDKTYEGFLSFSFAPYALEIQPLKKGKTILNFIGHISSEEYGVKEFIVTNNQVKEGKTYTVKNEISSDKPSSNVPGYRPEVYSCLYVDYLENRNCKWGKY